MFPEKEVKNNESMVIKKRILYGDFAGKSVSNYQKNIKMTIIESTFYYIMCLILYVYKNVFNFQVFCLNFRYYSLTCLNVIKKWWYYREFSLAKIEKFYKIQFRSLRFGTNLFIIIQQPNTDFMGLFLKKKWRHHESRVFLKNTDLIPGFCWKKLK